MIVLGVIIWAGLVHSLLDITINNDDDDDNTISNFISYDDYNTNFSNLTQLISKLYEQQPSSPNHE